MNEALVAPAVEAPSEADAAFEAPSEADAAFEALYRSSRDDVFAYASGLLRDRAAAEDVTAQAFERAYRRRKRFDPRAAHRALGCSGSRADAKEYERRFAGPANFLVAAVFAASIPVALLSPTAATLMWLLIFLVGRWLSDVIAGQRAPR
ncbi:MAG: RNA polymerase sigma factor [Solirubrobacterales bacterium]